MENETKAEKLFSYGTLQQETVQVSTFGRKLNGSPDVLPEFKLAMIEVLDQDFVKTSGAAHHHSLRFTGNVSDFVKGEVFTITKKELEQADEYEPDGYERVIVELRSGSKAWVYLNTTSIK